MKYTYDRICGAEYDSTSFDTLESAIKYAHGMWEIDPTIFNAENYEINIWSRLNPFSGVCEFYQSYDLSEDIEAWEVANHE